MEETESIWMNGDFVPWEKAKVHVLSHALHYGSGVFEGIRVYDTSEGSRIFRLKEHIERLFSSAEVLKMEIPYSKEEICEAVKKTVKANNIKDGYIRPIAFYGRGKIGVNPLGAKVNVAIAVWPWPSYIGEEASVMISNYIRIHPGSLASDKKVCGHYINSILANFEAKDNGYDEALLFDYEGNVAEGPGENLFLVKNEKIYTVPSEGKILPGITRDTVIEISKDLGYEVEEKNISKEDLFEADELFFTGTAAEVTPITKLDNKEFPKGEISLNLRKKYLDIVRGKDKKYEKYLD